MEQVVNSPEVTVLMSVYNCEKYVKQSVDSILGQTFANFEFLIFDDGSTDKTFEILQSFKDSRIRLVKNEKNEGIIKTMNKGIDMGKGTFVARMDGDDISFPKRLEKQVNYLKSNPAVALVAAKIITIDNEGIEQGYWGDDILAIAEEQIRNILPNENCIAQSTVMIRRDVLAKYKYALKQKDSEDWDLWLRLASAGEPIHKIDEVLVKYRIHAESVTVVANRNSLYRKKYKVQKSYCLQKLQQGQFNAFDFKVLKGATANYLKHILYSINPNSIRGLRKVFGTNIFKALKQYNNLKSFCDDQANDKVSLHFFFPFYHVGGAEKVHAQILESVRDKRPVVFITDVSSGAGYYKQFAENAAIVEISLISDYPVIHNWVKNTITKHLDKVANPVVFGCNSRLFYSLIPQVDSKVKCIDLIHAFVHPNEPGPEKWSLPVVERINGRVVIGKNTIGNFKILYKKNNISDALLNRIIYIPNYTFIPVYSAKEIKDKLTILYVGRSTPEKRVWLVEKIANELNKKGNHPDFIMAGRIDKNEPGNCKYLGEIADEEEMRKIYNEAHILLLTSSREGVPMVIQEAMANGLVVISTDVGGISGIINSYETGILIPSGTEEDIVQSFVANIEKLSKEKALYGNISLKAYNFARDNFNKTNFIQSYRHLLLD